METKKPKSVETETEEIKALTYCRFCGELITWKQVISSGFSTIFVCSCKDALENDRINKRLEKIENESSRLKEKQKNLGKIGESKLNERKFRASVRNLAIESGQPVPIFPI